MLRHLFGSAELAPGKRSGGIRPLFLLPVVAVGLIRAFVMFPIHIEGVSMLPTLEDGHVCWVNRLAYVAEPPQRGDIVCLWTGKERLVKRVLGLPREELAIRNGVVRVNNQPLAEPYLVFRGDWTIHPGTIGADRYVVVGDNRSGPREVLQDALLVRRDRIIGKVIGIRSDLSRGPDEPAPPTAFAPSRAVGGSREVRRPSTGLGRHPRQMTFS